MISQPGTAPACRLSRSRSIRGQRIVGYDTATTALWDLRVRPVGAFRSGLVDNDRFDGVDWSNAVSARDFELLTDAVKVANPDIVT